MLFPTDWPTDRIPEMPKIILATPRNFSPIKFISNSHSFCSQFSCVEDSFFGVLKAVLTSLCPHEVFEIQILLTPSSQLSNQFGFLQQKKKEVFSLRPAKTIVARKTQKKKKPKVKLYNLNSTQLSWNYSVFSEIILFLKSENYFFLLLFRHFYK